MGTYAHLSLGGYRVFEYKSGVHSDQLSPFCASDRREWIGTYRDRLSPDDLLPGEDPSLLDEKLLIVAYRALAWQCIDRLEVRDHALGNAKDDFACGLQGILDVFDNDRDYLEAEGITSDDVPGLGCRSGHYGRSERFFRELTFEVWLENLGIMVGEGIYRYESRAKQLGTRSMELDFVVTSVDDREYGWLGQDSDNLLRCFLEVIPKNAIVELDITDLITAGWVDSNEEVVGSTPWFTILTEGKSDKWILERSLSCLFPHLAPYYRFADFEASGLSGGAPDNVKVIRTMIALSLRDRLIVLFDNDAAGWGAIAQLKALTIPPNVRVLALPDLDFAERYPTVGAQGQTLENVNRRALSIEFFLGRHLLLSRNGGQIPVRWKSLMTPPGEYQGELDEKASIKSSFDAILDRPDAATTHDWQDMNRLLAAIFNAYRL